jgi:hypothetical protein
VEWRIVGVVMVKFEVWGFGLGRSGDGRRWAWV